ncbi:SDR family oxidoreductase [Sphingomonas naphthae]|uniref:SDR family oxidoreductase n=1 Tax=Sphingomonas naphthae TaxID=1813468 RepID=A0ABY7TGU7_9SPHN|nr:SDR family oxidoreductase [Sphingomonas naphthae]WCT72165.1 SDR family oxidoreductase [Sphingomonas naphthae]
MAPLAGQAAIVTGAASPIGQATARMLQAEAVSLVLADIDPAAMEAAGWRDGEGCATLVADLSQQEGAVALVALALERFGRLDILVNNAGGGVIRPFLKQSPKTLHATLDRNLWTCIWMCHAALPAMVERGYGRIVNVGADSVRNGLLAHAAYNAAKGGMHGLTTGLAREFAEQDITVNTVAPAMVRTPFVERETAAGNPFIKEFIDVIPKRRAAEPDEVASMIVHLARPESGFVTGQVMSVNGGSAML